MAIKQLTPTYECTAPKKKFIIDTDADVASLPNDCGSGSAAISVASGNIFIKNASGAWKLYGGGE